MEFLQHIYENSNFPLLTALILGLMTALSPCPLAMNITAIAFIGKDIEEKKKVFYSGLYYTLGRAISYTGLGFILYFGASKFQIARFLQLYGERILGPLLLVIGVIMLDIIRFRLPTFTKLSESVSTKKKRKWFSALLLGFIFALAFCPSSAVFYFGILIPMTITQSHGLWLPLIFAIGTGLPVIIFAYLISFTVSGVGKFYKHITVIEKWVRRITAACFIVVGIYYIFIFYIP
jgi:cytochrome c-type biogenesis protein